MAGGGHIIIRNSVKSTAELSTVSDNLTQAEIAQRDAVLAKQVGDWTQKDLAKLQRLIGIAHKRC